MHVPVKARGLFKSVLSLSRAKLIYARITLTTHTTAYFCFTLVSCLVLSSLHGVLLSDNTTAVNILYDSVLPSYEELALSPKLTRVVDEWLQVCDGIPGDGDTKCTRVVDLTGQGRRPSGESLRRRELRKRRALKKREMQRTVRAIEEAEGVSVKPRKMRLIRRQNSTSVEDEAESAEDGAESVSSGDDNEVSSASDDEGEESAGEEEEESGGIIILPGPTPSPSPSSIFIPSATPSSTSIIGASGLPVPTGTAPAVSQPTSQAGILAAQRNIPLIFDENCLFALTWLEDGLHDAQREDVTLVFANLWMGVIGIIAILTESLPHLIIAFFAHVLSGAWASSRIVHTQKLTRIYATIFMGQGGLCASNDLLGNWWDLRMKHTIPLVVVNALSVVVLAYLSWRLFRVYQVQTFSRVGASPAVHRMYRLLLSFSVFLQLSTFFSLASASLWIARATGGVFMQFAQHWKVYTAVFVVFMLLLLPWVVIGWRCLRKECRTRSIAFFTISLVLLGISSVMFASALYRTIFNRWSFFATLTVTSFILVVITTALGVACRINFGKGLAEYLDVSDALDGANFTPVRFDTNPGLKESKEKVADPKEGWTTFDNDNEKGGFHARNASGNTFSEVMLPQPLKPAYHDVERQQFGSYQFALQPASSQSLTPLDGGAQDPFQTAAELTSQDIDRAVNKARASRDGDSVWSSERSPIKLSYSPTIVRGKPTPHTVPRVPPPSAWAAMPTSPQGGESKRASMSASTIMPDDSASRVGVSPPSVVMDIRRGAQGEFRAVDAVPPSIQNSPLVVPQLQSRWSATTLSTVVPPPTIGAAGQDKTMSVISEARMPHPALMVANPDTSVRGSVMSEVPVPPVPIPTTGRGMVAPFPVGSARRSKEL